MAVAGFIAGAAFGLVMARLARSYFLDVKMPGALPVALSAFVLLAAAIVASSVPAVRAARIDVMKALRAECSPVFERMEIGITSNRPQFFQISSPRLSIFGLPNN